jgi:hypothetical protein
MTQRIIKNNYGVWLSPMGANNNTSATNTMSTAGNKRDVIGRLFWITGSGTKTVSAAGGGKIIWRSGASTFASASTTFRIGIQDINSSGVPDAVFDVYTDFVGGTDTMTNNTRVTTFAVGTKDITHGSVIALTGLLVTKGGSDSVVLVGTIPTLKGAGGSSHPYGYVNATRTLFTTTGGIIGMIQADDGTLGLIENITIPFANFGVTYSSSSTPDEYAIVFKVPFKCTLSGASIQIGNVSSTRTFEVVLYSDPEGTPTQIEAVTFDPNLVATTGIGQINISFSNNHILQKDTWYAVSVKPTSTNTFNLYYFDFLSGNSHLKQISDFGADIKSSARTNNTGPFVEQWDYRMLNISLRVSAFDDGLGRIKNIDGIPYQTIS